MRQRMRQLDAAARDPGMVLARAPPAACRRRGTAPALSTRRVAGKTLPARISACARVRLSASPRSTSAWSARLAGPADAPQASRRLGHAPGRLGAERPRAASAALTICGAFSPASSYCFFGFSWSMKRSGSAHAAGSSGRGRAGRASARCCSTKLPKPPTEPSSMVISTSCSRASRSTSAVSSGLAKRASATVVDRPRARQLLGRLQAFRQPGAVGEDARRWCPRAGCGPRPISQRRCRAPAARGRCPRRAGSGRRSGRSSMAAAVATMCISSSSSAARHQHDVRQAAEIGDVEGAGMGRAVGADQPGAVHGEAHRQVLQRHVVHHLVVGALQEGRVDRAERLHALGRHAGGEGDGVLLGDADVEGALREALGEGVEAGAGRHGGGDGDDRGRRPRPRRSARWRRPWCRSAGPAAP